MTFDPYQPPTANLDAPDVRASDTSTEVPPSVIAILAETRPWLRLVVGAFVTTAVLMVAAVVVLGMMGSFFSRGRHLGISLSLLTPLGLMALVYAPPVIYLARFARGIRRLQIGGGLPALEDSLRNQKHFWKYIGILFLAVVALYAIVLIAHSLT